MTQDQNTQDVSAANDVNVVTDAVFIESTTPVVTELGVPTEFHDATETVAQDQLTPASVDGTGINDAQQAVETLTEEAPAPTFEPSKQAIYYGSPEYAPAAVILAHLMGQSDVVDMSVNTTVNIDAPTLRSVAMLGVSPNEPWGHFGAKMASGGKPDQQQVLMLSVNNYAEEATADSQMLIAQHVEIFKYATSVGFKFAVTSIGTNVIVTSIIALIRAFSGQWLSDTDVEQMNFVESFPTLDKTITTNIGVLVKECQLAKVYGVEQMDKDASLLAKIVAVGNDVTKIDALLRTPFVFEQPAGDAPVPTATGVQIGD